MIRVLGVDAALRRSGWALVEERERGLTVVQSGFIAPTGQSRSAVLADIHLQFTFLIESSQPGIAYFEDSGLWRRKGGTSNVGLTGIVMARGVMLAACGNRGLSAKEVGVREVRNTLLLSPNAGKEDVLHWLERRGYLAAKTKGRPDLDISDAVALGIYGALHEGASFASSTRIDESDD